MSATLSRGRHARRGSDPQSLLDQAKLLQFALSGSAGEDGGAGDGGSGAGTGGSPAGGSATGGDGGNGTGTGNPDPAEDPDKDLPQEVKDRIKAANDEAAARRREHSEAQRALAEVQAQLRKFEDKDKSELEKAQRDSVEFKNKAEAAAGRLKDQAIKLEFLSHRKHEWHDPKAAMRLLDLSDVEINDDGEVKGLDKAIDKLAKDAPYLIKPAADPNAGRGPNPSNPRRGGGNQPDIQAMSRTFPALRSRVQS